MEHARGALERSDSVEHRVLRLQVRHGGALRPVADLAQRLVGDAGGAGLVRDAGAKPDGQPNVLL
jgi:hypothetical protein